MSADLVAPELAAAVRRAAEAGGSIEEAAAGIAALIRTTSGRRWVGIYRVTAGEVVNLAWSGPAPPAHPTFPVGQGLTGDAIRGRATVCCNDVNRDPRYLTNQPTTGSELIVPVMRGGEVVGTLDVEDARPNAFTAADQRRFDSVAAALRPLYR
jgi:GAF domain-containing protein